MPTQTKVNNEVSTENWFIRSMNVFFPSLSIAILSNALLYFLPDTVSSTVEDYMHNNEIPKHLIEGMDTKNVRVYDENTTLSALYNGAINGLTYPFGFSDVINNVASVQKICSIKMNTSS